MCTTNHFRGCCRKKKCMWHVTDFNLSCSPQPPPHYVFKLGWNIFLSVSSIIGRSVLSYKKNIRWCLCRLTCLNDLNIETVYLHIYGWLNTCKTSKENNKTKLDYFPSYWFFFHYVNTTEFKQFVYLVP
jgi:hypothetical protein